MASALTGSMGHAFGGLINYLKDKKSKNEFKPPADAARLAAIETYETPKAPIEAAQMKLKPLPKIKVKIRKMK